MTSLDIQMHRSPNFGERRDSLQASLVVLHYTAMQSAEEAIARLCAPEFEVSAHYLIDEQGQIIQMVDESKRAWHAGAGRWGDVVDVNSHSIGIELSNRGNTPFAAAQMDALEQLLADILKRHDIPSERVIGHSDMAPHRKIDPGSRFDWQRLARLDLSIWPTSVQSFAVDPNRFSQWLAVFGYDESVEFSALLTGFRSRFRPRHEGPLDETDMALAQDLAARFAWNPLCD